jgi:hypothetical protein
MNFWRDPAMRAWNMFDFALVGMMVFENWMVPWLPIDANGLSQLSVLRLLRLLRISRIFRMIPELGMMVKSMTAAFRSVSSTIMLAVGVMYVFSIIMTQWAKGRIKLLDKEIADMDAGKKSATFRDQAQESRTALWTDWGHLGRSYLSLMQIMIGDDAFSLTRRIFDLDGLMGMVSLIFMAVGSFTVLNMLIGVICEIVSDTKAQEEDKMFIGQCIDVFDALDKDGNGILTREEFMENANLMRKLGLEPGTGGTAFDLLDTDGSGSLEMYEFIDMLLKLMHPPQTQDILSIKASVSAVLQKVCPELVGGRLNKKSSSRKEITEGANLAIEDGTTALTDSDEDTFIPAYHAEEMVEDDRELDAEIMSMLTSINKKHDRSMAKLDKSMAKIDKVEAAMRDSGMLNALNDLPGSLKA